MGDEVIFYTTHCPRCSALEMMLKKKKIVYVEKRINPNNADEIKIMTDLGLQSAPGLVVNGEVKDFPAAMAWVRER